MANCPNCGSSHITLKKETNVNWGRAVAGWALFGAVGGAVGAVTGEDRNANACLDCGTSWKAEDLYRIIKTIKSSTGKELDLNKELDRSCMNSFVTEVGPYIKAIPKAEKKAADLLVKTQEKTAEQTATGCASGCAISLIGTFTLTGILSGIGIWVMLLAPPLIGIGIGVLMDKTQKQSVMKEIEQAQNEAVKIKQGAEQDLKYALRDFTNKYST